MICGWAFVFGKPVVRGYNTLAIYREDCLHRKNHLQVEVEADMRELARMKKEYAATEEQLRKRKKEFGWTD